jgi:hypothetical protein
LDVSVIREPAATRILIDRKAISKAVVAFSPEVIVPAAPRNSQITKRASVEICLWYDLAGFRAFSAVDLPQI